MRVKYLMIVFCLISLNYGALFGQEIQIKMDADGLLDVIDQNLEQKLNLFPDYEQFREARLYQVSDSVFVLEIFVATEAGTVKERILLSLAEKSAFQQKVTKLYNAELARRDSQAKQKPKLDHSGRAELLIGTFGLSAGFYSWGLPVVLDIDNPKIAVSTGLLSSVFSFYIPYATTKSVSVTEGVSAMTLWGGTRGILHGMAVGAIIAGEDVTFRGLTGLAMAFSIGEAVAGYQIANKYQLDAGKAMEINFIGDLGVYWSLGVGQLLDLFDEYPERMIPTMGLLGTGFGLWTGTKLANDVHYSKGDVHLQYTVQSLSLLVPIATLSLFDAESTDLYIATMMASSYAGLRIGHGIARGRDFSVGQGVLIELGTSAGGCLGLALAYLFTPESSETGKPYITLGTLGALGGFYFTYNAFRDDARESHEERSNLSFRLCPENILMQAVNKKLGNDTEVYLPAFRLGFSF